MLDGGLLTTVFGVTTLIAAGLAGLTWGTVKTLRETNADLRLRVQDLEDGRATDKGEIAQLRSDAQALGRLVTGEVHWSQLVATLDTHHTEAQTEWARQATRDAEIMAALQRLEGRQ